MDNGYKVIQLDSPSIGFKSREVNILKLVCCAEDQGQVHQEGSTITIELDPYDLEHGVHRMGKALQEGEFNPAEYIAVTDQKSGTEMTIECKLLA